MLYGGKDVPRFRLTFDTLYADNLNAMFKLLTAILILSLYGCSQYLHTRRQPASMINKSYCINLLKRVFGPSQTRELKELDEVISVKLRHGETKLKWILDSPSPSGFGGSSAYVYVSDDGLYVHKFYPIDEEVSSARAQTFYEYWITKYLRSKGINVLDVLEKPFRGSHPHIMEKGYWVTKPYITGVTAKEIQLLQRNKARIAGVSKKAINEDLRTKKDAVRNHYEHKEIIAYIQENSDIKNPVRILRSYPRWTYGDFSKDANWLFTEEAWVLIDP